MKRPAGKTLQVKEFDDLVQAHKMKEVSPPTEANRDLISGGKSNMTIQEATAKWFKTAKEQKPSSGFLVKDETVDISKSLDREMLYKGKKKSKE